MGFLVYVLISVATSFVGALLTAYLAGKAKGPAAEPFVPPDISPGTPITLLIGCGRVRPVFTMWGPVKTEDIRQQVGSSFFGLVPIVQTVGKRYKITAQGVLCWGMVESLRNIVFDPNNPISDQPLTTKRLAAFKISPSTTGPTGFILNVVDQARQQGGIDIWTRVLYGGHRTITLYCPTIFGGEDRGGGGGAWGDLEFYVGSMQHGPSGVLEAIAGVGNVPSYRELAYIVYNQFVVGTRPSMPPIDYIVTAYPQTQIVSGLGQIGAVVNQRTVTSRNLKALTTLGQLSEWRANDVDPIYPIIVLWTHTLAGLARDPAELDMTQLNGVAGTAAGEGIGVSVQLVGAKQQAIAKISELLQIMDGVLLRHPETGKIQIKLVREEAYSSMRVFGPSEIIDADLTRREWGDTFNEVTVFFSDADKLYDEDFVTVRDKSNIAATGSVRPIQPIHLPSVTYRPLATAIALRELRHASGRLASGTVKCTRVAWDVERGDVARFNMPWLDLDDSGFGQLVARVRAVNLGSPQSNVVTLTIIEDVFAQEDAQIEIVDAPSGTEPPSSGVAQRAPQIMPSQWQNATTGYLDLAIIDLDLTITAVEYSASSGGGTPTAWASFGTAPLYEASVALDGTNESSIAWRVTYMLDGAQQTASGSVTFAATGNPFTAGSLDGSTNPIIWDVTGKTADSKNVSVPANRTLSIIGATPGFHGWLFVTSSGAGAGTYTLTLPLGSIYGDGATNPPVVSLGVKDQFTVTYDGTYYWWTLVTHATTLPPIPLAATLTANDSDLIAALFDMAASISSASTASGDPST